LSISTVLIGLAALLVGMLFGAAGVLYFLGELAESIRPTRVSRAAAGGGALKLSKMCEHAGCAQPALWTPQFSLRPPVHFAYRGEPIQARVGLALCEQHRIWFVEVGWKEFLPPFIDIARSVGAAVDPDMTTVKMFRITEVERG
jgi:hypothetical protein